MLFSREMKTRQNSFSTFTFSRNCKKNMSNKCTNIWFSLSKKTDNINTLFSRPMETPQNSFLTFSISRNWPGKALPRFTFSKNKWAAHILSVQSLSVPLPFCKRNYNLAKFIFNFEREGIKGILKALYYWKQNHAQFLCIFETILSSCWHLLENIANDEKSINPREERINDPTMKLNCFLQRKYVNWPENKNNIKFYILFALKGWTKRY